MQEIREAEKVRDSRLGGVRRIIKEYAGRWYASASDWTTDITAGILDNGDYNPEPYAYSFVTNMLPALTYSDPAVNVKARRVIGHAMVQSAMKDGYRAWMRDTDYAGELEKVVLDCLFAPQGVLLHYIEDDTRWADGAVRPKATRIDFNCYFADSLSKDPDEDEFRGHKYWVDIEDLMADPALKPEVLMQIQKYQHQEDDKQKVFEKGNTAPLRKRICLRSVWQRRTNVIRVIAEIANGLEIYEPREWYGPKKIGPYVLFQGYPIPNENFGLSPLVAVQDQVCGLQAHAKATGRSAAGRKTVIIVDGTQQNLAEDIKNAGDREVISVPGFSASQLQQIELGGVTPQQYEYLNFLRARLDRHGGLTETARGNTDPGTTATADTIASEAMGNRVEYLRARIRRACKDSLYVIGWFMFNTTGIIIPVTVKDPISGIETEGLFFGGPVDGVQAGTWEDYDLEIEPYSMGRTSEATTQRRAMDWANFLVTMAPMIPQLPYIRWQEVIRMVGEAMNQDNAETMINWAMLAMMPPPDMMNPSQEQGSEPEQPGRYFSQPGMGFKPMDPAGMSNAPMVDPRRQEFGKQYGPMGGGKQGPPGSAGTGSLMSGAYR